MSSNIMPRHRGISLFSAFAMSMASLAGMGVMAVSSQAQAVTIDATNVVGDTSGDTGIQAQLVAPMDYVTITDNRGGNYFPMFYTDPKTTVDMGTPHTQAIIDETMEYVARMMAYGGTTLSGSQQVGQAGQAGWRASRVTGTTVLAGDSIGFYGAMVGGSSDRDPDNPLMYTWSPDVTTPSLQGAYWFNWKPTDFAPADAAVWNMQDDPDLGHPYCASTDQGLRIRAVTADGDTDPTMVVGITCEGPAGYYVIYNDVQASPDPTSPEGPFFGYTLQLQRTFLAEALGPEFSRVSNFLAPQDEYGNANAGTIAVTFSVVDPKLDLKKQVCSTGTGCATREAQAISNGATAEEAAVAAGWVDDATFGDPTEATGLELHGVPDGVGQGVEQAVLSTTAGDTIEWKMTVRNSGNVSLYLPEIGADVVTVDPPADDDSPQLVEDTCIGAKFPTGPDLLNDQAYPFMADAESSLVCTTTFDRPVGGWSGAIQNTAGANAQLPAGWLIEQGADLPYNENLTSQDDPTIMPMQFPPDVDSRGNYISLLPNGNPIPPEYLYISFNDPYNVFLGDRFTGYAQATNDDGSYANASDPTGTWKRVPSNTDSAQVAMAQPGLKITKWVCDNNGTHTGCQTNPTNSVLDHLAGYVSPSGTAPLGTVVTSSPDGGWVKSTTVDYYTAAEWAVVITNTGNTYLSDFTVSDIAAVAGTDISDDMSAQLQQALEAELAGGTLNPGESILLTLKTDHVTATGEHGTFDYSDEALNSAKEPAYTANETPDLVNEVSVTAGKSSADDAATEVFVDDDGNPVPVEAEPSQAEVNTSVDPGVKVTKWVCPASATCADPTPAQLVTLSGVSTTDPVRTGATAGDWVKSTTNTTYGTDASWLIVAGNTGNTYLKITKEQVADQLIGGKGHGTLSAITPDSITLAPNSSGFFRVNTDMITNTTSTKTTYQGTADEASKEFPLDTAGSEVVNEVKLTATPVTDSTGDVRLPAPDTDPNATNVTYMDPVESNLSYAEINTVPPKPGIKVTKWVCDVNSPDAVDGACVRDLTPAQLAVLSGVSVTDGTVSVTTGASLGGWVKETNVKYNKDADWLVVVANMGNTHLTNVVVKDAGAEGMGHGETALPSFDPIDLDPGQAHFYLLTTQSITSTGPVNPEVVGQPDEIFQEPEYATGEVATVAGEPGVIVNRATASGEPSDDEGNRLPKENTDPEDEDPMDPVESNESSAEVSSTPPDVPIELAKYVCDPELAKDLAPDGVCPMVADLTPEMLENLRGKDNPGMYGWVPLATVIYGTDADWLIVVTNNHDELSVTNVQIAVEEVLNDNDASPSVPDGCTVGTSLTEQDQLLGPQESIAINCSTSTIFNIKDVEDNVINTAKAKANPVDPDTDQPYPAPDGEEGLIEVESNDDSAEVNTILPEPGIDLAKWVCSKGTGCTPWASLNANEKTLLVNPNSTVDATGSTTGGWVKSAKVGYNTPVDWLLVATNTGNTRLNDVKISTDVVDKTYEEIPAGCAVGTAFNPTKLDPLDSGYITCTTPAVTTVKNEESSTPLKNTTTAVGKPTDPEDNPYPPDDPDNPEVPPEIPSDPDEADVYTEYNPSIALSKWVCSTGQDCPDFAELSAAGQATLRDPDARPAANDPSTGGWVKQAQVPWNTHADWLILIRNTGDVVLDDVHFSLEQVTGDEQEQTAACAQNTRVSDTHLEVGGEIPVRCTTETITNKAAWGSGDDVINTAEATGTPVLFDKDNNKIRVPRANGEEGVVDPIKSNQDAAEVNTKALLPEIDIIKYDVVDGDDMITGDYNDTAKVMTAGRDAEIWMTIVNTGTDDLINVVVTDKTTEGSGTIQGLTCDFSALGGPETGTTWDGPFLPDDSFICKGTLPGLAAGQTHTDVATVTARGVSSEEDVSDSDPWKSRVPGLVAPEGGLIVDPATQRGSLSLAALLAFMLLGSAVIIVRRHTAK